MKNINLGNLLNVLLILLVVIVLVLGVRLSLNINNFKHKDAAEQYNILTKKYGNPSISDLSEGGIAIWKKEKLKGTCFHEIKLLDESVSHCVPAPHRDFLYTYVKYEVPDDKVLDVISLSGSVAYDPLKKELRARCGSEAANITTLYLATAIGNSNVTIQEVQNNKLYSKAINSIGNKQNVEIYYKKLCKELEEQPGNPNWSGYFGLAFSEGCCDGYDPNKNTCGKQENFKTDKSEKFTDKTDKNKNDPTLEPVIV